MVSKSLVRRISMSDLSLRRSPVSQTSTLPIEERRNKQGAMTSPKNRISDHGIFPTNFNIKERLQSLRSHSFLQLLQQHQQKQQQQITTASKRVTFSEDKPDYFATLSRADFSLEEACSYWVQPDETKASIDRNWVIIDAHEKAKKNKDSKFSMCTRGLESYILERQRGKKIHSTKQKNAHMAVLLWGKGLSDEERARRYRLVSKRCVKRALEYARRDATTARRILTKDTVGALSATHSIQCSDRSCSSTISTQSELDLPCVPKRLNDDWSRHGDKEGSKSKTKKGKLRPCLKQAAGTIPEILPIIYVRTRKVHVRDRREGRSKTRGPSKNRADKSERNSSRSAPRLANSSCSRLVSPGQAVQKHKRSPSLPSSPLPVELPREEDNRKQIKVNNQDTTNPTPDGLPRGRLDDEIQPSREAVIARLIHSAYPRCPRPSHLGCDDDRTDASSPSASPNSTSTVRVKPNSQANCSSSL